MKQLRMAAMLQRLYDYANSIDGKTTDGGEFIPNKVLDDQSGNPPHVQMAIDHEKWEMERIINARHS